MPVLHREVLYVYMHSWHCTPPIVSLPPLLRMLGLPARPGDVLEALKGLLCQGGLLRQLAVTSGNASDRWVPVVGVVRLLVLQALGRARHSPIHTASARTFPL